MADSSTKGDRTVSRDDLEIPVGVERVAATRYQPQDVTGALPVLFSYYPYRKDDYITYGFHEPTYRYFASNGYNVVIADMVGTGASTGALKSVPFTGSEGKEAAKIIEWLADQDWSTGNVGMFGMSYGGITSLEAAVNHPSGLKTIVPIMATHDLYQGYFEGGCFALYRTGGSSGPWFEWLPALPPSRRDDKGSWAELWHSRLDELRHRKPYLFQWFENKSENDYWKSKKIEVEQIEIPTFVFGGSRDPYADTTFELFERLDVPKRLIFGPWRHVMPHLGRETKIAFHRIALEWFDHFVKGEDTTVLDQPSISYWTERAGGGVPERGVWRGTESWPNSQQSPTVNEVTFFLTATGLSKSASLDSAPLTKEYTVDHTVGLSSSDMDVVGGYPLDTSPDDSRSLTLDTSPLESPIELTGTGKVHIYIRTAMQDPVLVARLIDLSPTGRGSRVTHGVCRVKALESGDRPASGTHGDLFSLTFPLKPGSHLFETGHRIRLAISGAFFPYILPTLSRGSFTVASTPENISTLRFPGQVHRPGEVKFDDEYPLEAPQEELSPSSIIDEAVHWETTRDHTDDQGTFEAEQEFELDLPQGTMAYYQRIRAVVQADMPESAIVYRDTEASLQYPTERVTTTIKSRLGQHTAHLTNTITVDGQTIFDELWEWP